MNAMQPRMEVLAAKKLMGRRMTMSLIHNKTGELWKAFMQARKEIHNNTSDLLYSLQTYSPSYFTSFNPNTEFEKWAAIEVADFGNVPAGMETFELPGGLYAVFLHKGGPATGAQTFQYIFGTWLPASGYLLDNRPHFEVLGDKYRNDDPASEEEIWIPVRPIV